MDYPRPGLDPRAAGSSISLQERAKVKKSSSRTVGHLVDSVERARVRMRVLGGVTVASLLAAVVVFFVSSPLVGRVGAAPAFAGSSLVRTIQDSTVVCTVPELHGKSDFHIYYSRNYTGRAPFQQRSMC
jgi:hypothetical protein